MLRNDDNLRAYAEYPLSRKTQPPNLLLCLSPGQSFPMTEGNIKISKYTIGSKNFVVVNKQKKLYTTIAYTAFNQVLNMEGKSFPFLL